MCPRLSYLELSYMYSLSETGRLSMGSLFRQIIQNDPQIKALNIQRFSGNDVIDQSIDELILESLLSSNIDSITDLNLVDNSSWFKLPGT